ncbi:MAG: ABC transporter permease subunit [Oscillospiraceae bacterium]|jgi:ABC-2 type transport system permease protein|nr:ABC transporter permease subunit [Oscillospiraceae bacterium]
MLAVFKRDFKAYFTSAIGYIYLGAYILVLNLLFYLNNALGASPSLSGVFSFMLMVMMFVTPILTMRVFSEDFKQKTDQLLFTSPVKLSGIVMGKYLSSFAVFVCLLLLTLLWPFAISVFGENNTAEVVGNYIGILCIGAAYIAMGVFISSLTENQVVAAVGSLGLFVALYILEVVALIFYQSGALPMLVMRSLRFISIYGRYNDISRGVLALDDIVYFLSVCAIFLFLTVRGLEKRRWA